MLKKLVLTYFLAQLLAMHALAQNVVVSGAIVGNGSYPTLTAAFQAINGGAQSGANITLSIILDTYEGFGTAILNAGAWASINIIPSGQPRSIIGATMSGMPMIDLNGADRVTFNGALGGQPALTLHNTSSSMVGGTSTVRFRSAAQNNTLTYCRVLGAAQALDHTEGGNIVFAPGGTGGSSHNTISNCEIGPGGTALPNKLIYCDGGMQYADMNSAITISNCKLFDCFGVNRSSAALWVRQGASSWLVSGNSFYQTAPRTMASNGGTHRDIYFAHGYGNIFNTISNNVFGHIAPPNIGNMEITFQAAGGNYIPISVSGTKMMGGNTVTGNTIRNIIVHSSATVGATTPFVGIVMSETNGQVAGNLIGSMTTPGSIVVTGMQSGSTTVKGISLGNSDGQSHTGNAIGGIQVSNLNGGSAVFNGIAGGDYGSDITISANVIGAEAAPIVVAGSGAANSIAGISTYGNTLTIQGNTVSYLTTNVPATFTYFPPFMTAFAVTGINADNGLLGFGYLQRNTVKALSNTHPSARTSVVGIQSNRLGTVSENLVHSLALSTTDPAATIVGINLLQGDHLCYNNMVRLGIAPDGQSIVTGMPIFGIRNHFGQAWLDHNSIYIGGTGIADTADTYAIYSLTSAGNRRLLNNICYNARSNGSGTGSHYAISSGGTSTTSPLSDGNDLVADGNGGVTGFYDGQDRATIFDWRLATGRDFNSISFNPNFLQPLGTAAQVDLHLGPTSAAESNGVNGAIPNIDIDQQNRGGLSPIDIGADAGNYQQFPTRAPEALLIGNQLEIVAGDTSASSVDGTDFGIQASCSSATVTHVFSLRNVGNANLVIHGIQASGGSGFLVIATTPSTVLPGQTYQFSVQMLPSATATANSTITVLTNDADESNYSFAVAGIAAIDTIAPNAVCQNLNLYLGQNGTATATGSMVAGASSDNCGIASFAAQPAQFSCIEIGMQTVQIIVTDYAGLSASCVATVTVADTTAPNALCQNINLPLTPGGTALTTATALVQSASDNCGVDSIWASALAFSCTQMGANPVQVHVRDHQGQTRSCTAIVTVTDPIAPIALCQPATLQLDSQGLAQLSTASIDAGSSDNCGIATIATNQSTFGCGDVGTLPLVMTVTDASGNQAACSTTVTIQDTLPPALICADYTLTLSSTGIGSLSPSAIGTASDACAIAGYQLSQNQFTCADIGATPITLTAMDNAGNAATCTRQLTILAAPLSAALSPHLLGMCGYAISCAGQMDASATATPSGGCPPYAFTWSNGQSTATATALGAGNHSVTVTSADGQQSVQSILLIAPDTLAVSLLATPACATAPTGSLQAMSTGGQSCQGYAYLWSTGMTSSAITGLSPGNYSLTVTDAAGCATQAVATVTQLPIPTLLLSQVQQSIVATPGFASYQWYLAGNLVPGATSATIFPSTSGVYQVVAIDTNGCFITSADFLFNFVGIMLQNTGWETATIAPNPGNGLFHLALPNPIEGAVSLCITDLRGQSLWSDEFERLAHGQILNFTTIAKGVYVLQLMHQDGRQRRIRFVVQ